MATIKAIEGRSIHQIQSGQVIVDLCSVVKELVENSLDAGATSIEVRFRNHGLEAIEVFDNGKGIAPDDFETIALKHYTSKLSSYEDLTSLETFGFRGEALSSLCALSKFHIVTARAEDGPKGKRLDFETSGKLATQSIIAAQKGTAVFVENLFFNLPVRRKELEKNIKREYGKVINLLQAYACIGVGVRLAVSNQLAKGKKLAVFATNANTATKENVANVFGAKTLLALAKLDLKLELRPDRGPATQSAHSWSTQADKSLEVLVQGHISKPIFGEGRNAPDRQMFFVNSRPCLLPQVSKAINEVYKAFNVSQSPFIFANLVMDTNAYDVNVSPDKKTILLHDQTALLEHLKASLTEMFDTTDHTMPQSSLANKKLPAYQSPSIQRPQNAHGPFLESSPDSTSERLEDETREDHNTESLIAQWTSHDSRARKAAQLAGQETPGQNKMVDQQTSRNSNAIMNNFLEQNAVVMDETAKQRREGSSGLYPLSLEVDDFISQQPPNPTGNNSVHEPSYPIVGLGQPAQEPIHTFSTSSQKGVPGPVQNAFDRMRPKRTPKQTAEITIGDITTTTVIGSGPPFKRQRVHAPKNSQAIAAFGCSPALARDLRSFAAPGTKHGIDSGARSDTSYSDEGIMEGEDEDEDDDEGDTESITSSFDQGSVSDLHENTVKQVSQGSSAGATTNVSNPKDQQGARHPSSISDGSDEEYVDEREKKAYEDEKVARLIQEAERTATRPTEQNLRRASQSLKNSTGRKDSTYQLATSIDASILDIQQGLATLRTSIQSSSTKSKHPCDHKCPEDHNDEIHAESKLSLTVLKEDFGHMTIIGQFNLGFILAVRPASKDHAEDEMFIIDQHAADEKYNYERFQRTMVIQNQRLVRPKLLELSAVEEELVLNNQDALEANGFEIDVEITSTKSDEESSRRHFRLLTLPVSKEKTFELSDLEELLHLLSEQPPGSAEIPRPKKVQRMLAMRACRSSIMVGKTLTLNQMQKVVRNMGEMDKPWNCPHGRPTMRHLAGLGSWSSWKEEELVHRDHEMPQTTNWKEWLASR
ncbi:DNA mismatch repair protein MutL [Polychaeton citri CBS 116435]|uniref:DNA mismatch repair protein PMS1 n=1 Tax=Polychaeton citri CBS 116435 TaxID=1314669 RepID=A0A9P4QAT4_9PEZI|nr:DNA mismatch repair protein MutL [Polychaeton citri CBS 116435]